jgi:hypothetical protein
MPQALALSILLKDSPLSLRRSAPLRASDESDVRRWPRAWRLIFLILAGAACWILVAVLIWFLWLRFGA